MNELKSNLSVIRRLVANSQEQLFPRMRKRKEYLDSLVSENKEIPLALKAEIELNNQIREHVQLMNNYVLYLESYVDKNIASPISDDEYIQALEKELLHDFRQRNNISR